MNHDAALPEAPAESLPRKRRQMLEAATALFIERGYGAVSMDVVARAAGVSKATLYAHFASKDQLFATIVGERGVVAHVEDVLPAGPVDDLRAALQTIGERVLGFMLGGRTLAIFRIAIAESARFPELGEAFHAAGPQKFCDRVRLWLSVQQEAGLVRPVDLEVATQQFMALMRSSLFLRASLGLPPAPGEQDIHATVAAAVETWMCAFGTNPSEIAE